MTLIQRHKPLLKAALHKIKEIEQITELFNVVDDKYKSETCDRLRTEYLQIIKQIQWETELTVKA